MPRDSAPSDDTASDGTHTRRSASNRTPPGTASGRTVTLRAPVDGAILRRLRESESVVPAAESLVEIGDPRRLEIVADLLSTDAVAIPSGTPVIVDQWGGGRSLQGRVRLVEPAGFTKVSALGVEEQRVNVIIDFVDPVEAWKTLGDGYRVETRAVLWEHSNVLTVPVGALFRQGEAWATYVVQHGRAELRPVTIGHRTDREAEVLAGLRQGERVVASHRHPACGQSRRSARFLTRAAPSCRPTLSAEQRHGITRRCPRC